MKRTILITFLSLSLVFPSIANQRINALWIGNSLTGSSICDAGSFQLQWYVNGCKQYCDTSIPSPTGYILASGDALLGATMLSQHWTYGTGLQAVNQLPYIGGGESVRDPLGWGGVSVEHYDYCVLQPWAMINDANIQKEKVAFGKYCDTLLKLEVKPVIFGLYQEKDSTKASYDVYTHMYDSVYNLYKNQGALIAPVWKAYKKVWDIIGPAKLFVPGDIYGHESAMGVYINHCVFYATFTRHRSANIDWDMAKGQCSNLAVLDTIHDFLELKADEAVSEYYTLEGATGINKQVLPSIASTSKTGISGSYDLTGRMVRGNIGTARPGVYIMRNASSQVPAMLVKTME